ncbi:type II toxin-antitoxin system RelE family toxin [Staphylococcus agnetis]|uniref:type II toxin-antitoxin system RelE family toxin n=1 Tax=Staphylococcus agnetis TaxID=985762 RepID=UPI001C9C9072|nr:type II toxin-antitoxin system RelE/ParE family toxin [Staphylococcus agnetis]
MKWLYNNVHNSDNPRLHDKALQGELSNPWRYRVGKYRIIAEIQDAELVALATDVEIRGNVYKRK